MYQQDKYFQMYHIHYIHLIIFRIDNLLTKFFKRRLFVGPLYFDVHLIYLFQLHKIGEYFVLFHAVYMF